MGTDPLPINYSFVTPYFSSSLMPWNNVAYQLIQLIFFFLFLIIG